jgi:hypothetical protein
MSIKHRIARFYFKLRGIPTCAEIEDLAYDFLDGSLDEKLMKAIEKHMKLCPPCIPFIESYRRIKEMGAREESPPLTPDFKQHLKKMFTP